MTKKIATVSILATILLAVISAIATHFTKMLCTPVIKNDNCRIFIHESDTRDSVLRMISETDSSASTDGLRLWMKFKDTAIRPGCYVIPAGKNARDITNMLSSGSQTPVRLVINSVRTVGQMAGNISSQLMMDSLQMIRCLTDAAFLDSAGYTPQTVFCAIIPNTYEVWWTVTPEALIARLIKESEKFWNASRKEKARQTGLSNNEILTLASIVEEETSLVSDMPVIAGLYMNRLKRNMPLQSDPTVIFALGGERPKRVLKEHLEIDSPYNTYKHTGLPPAPIRFTSIQAIDAVLNYAHHNYLYMCASDKLDGHTNFAATLAQHNINARRYQRALSQAGIYR